VDRDPYAVLGVLPGATHDEIRAAWRSISKKAHPDVGGSAEQFREALAAYRLLSSSSGARLRGDATPWIAENSAWDVEPWLVETFDDRWVFRPPRSVISALAIAMATLVLLMMLLAPAVIALGR